MTDPLAVDIEAYLRSLSPAEQAKIAEAWQKEVEGIDELAALEERGRKKGLVSKKDMIYDIVCEITCRTCGANFNTKCKSSSPHPIKSTTVLCGQCAKVLMEMPKEELVRIIMEKDKEANGVDKSYVPRYIAPTHREESE